MKTTAKLAAATAIVMSLGGAALAAGGHGHNRQDGPAVQSPGAGKHDMMQMMMRMHSMMGAGGAMPGMGVMGDRMGMAPRMGMMGPGGPMMGGMGMMSNLDVDGDGVVAPDEARTGLGNLLTEHDADGDGTLSIDEFEALHNALIREAMVDRFQHLDADGDGSVTEEEMQAPALRLERMQTMRERMMDNSGDVPGRMMPGQGRMMDGSGNNMQ